ncbi:DUF4232 domain-containing protein [Actinomyces sp. MRS3W]|uniref:DUF4232 domain-containing protein n=1 Tax=Actinomyces sp. MRS3W TaxID=2800796 RepID=UPI0028FD1069|nr:DUF4232 domain-containing protein [Actinomyces sp. MRS3W]MDU0347340.1 DUF4232 domain-containing protein [Actinomyces sp. MRS3W]
MTSSPASAPHRWWWRALTWPWRHWLAILAHLTGITATILCPVIFLILNIRQRAFAADPDRPDDTCAYLLDKPPRSVRFHESWLSSCCQILDLDGGVLANVPLSPSWWPWAARGVVAMGLVAIIMSIKALGLQDGPRRPLARRLVIGAMAMVLVMPCAAAFVIDRVNSPDPVALAQARKTSLPGTLPGDVVAIPTISPNPCAPENLTYWHLWDDAALGGHRIATIAVENTSTAPCTVSGWPDVVVRDEDGAVLSVPVIRIADRDDPITSDQDSGQDAATAAPVVELGSGARATATVQWSEDPRERTGISLSINTEAGEQPVTDDPDPDDRYVPEPDKLTIPEGYAIRVTPWKHE